MARGLGLLGGVALLVLAAGVAALALTRGGEDEAPSLVVSPDAPRGDAVGTESEAVATPSFARAGSVFGAVLSGKHGIPDARRKVTLAWGGVPPLTVATDGWGGFRFDGVPADVSVAVRVEAAGCATENVAGLVLLPGESRSVGDLTLDAPATFRIEVVDDAGAPIAGATVDAFRAASGPIADFVERASLPTTDVPAATRTTDADGHATFDVAPMRSFTFAASAPGVARVAEASNYRAAGVRDEIRLVLPKPQPLTGRVLDGSGRRVSRAVVVARALPRVTDDYHGTRAEGPGLWTRTVADAAGRFAFEALPPGVIELRVAAAGGVPAGWERVDTRGVTDVELHVRPTGTLVGRVTDETSGAPIPGTTVAIAAGGAAWIAVTDDQGKYVMSGVIAAELSGSACIPPAGWTMPRPRVPRGAHAPQVEPDRELRVDWTAQRAAVVEGRVTANGAPLLGAMVDVLRVAVALDDSRWEADGRTDADGRFRIDDVPAGRVAVCVTPPGASDYDTRSEFRKAILKDSAARALAVFDVAADATAHRDVSVTLPSADARETADSNVDRQADEILGSRRVRFVCRVRTSDGVPLRDARIAAGPAELMDDSRDALRFARGVPLDGDCELMERAKDGDQVFAVAAADANHDVTIVKDVAVAADAKEVAVDVVLVPLPVLRCCVVRNGDPVAGAEIRVGATLVAKSAADGTFSLRMRAGNCRLSVEAAGCVRQVFDEIEIPQDGVVDLALDAAEVIEGVVVDIEGKPLAGVCVTPVDRRGDVAEPYGESWSSPTPPEPPVTGADGRFRIAELPTGEFGLRVSAATGDAAVATVTSKPFATGTLDVRIVARRPSVIAGRVVGARGNAVVRARVLCVGDDDVTGEEDDRDVRTGPDGAFEFAGLLEGKYRLDVRAVPRDELTPGRFRMAAGRTDVVLALVPAGVITGIVVAPDGQPVPRAVVEAVALGGVEEDVPKWDGRLESWAGTDGRFRVVVPPGRRYALTFASSSRFAEDAVLRGGEDVAADASDLRLVAVTGLAFGGKIQTEKGMDVWDADIEVMVAGVVVRRYRTGGAGRFKMSGFEPCTADLAVHAPGRVPTLVRGVPAGALDLTIVLPVGDSITGQLLDAKGDPATAWRIRARRVADPETDLWRTIVRRDGEFSIQGLDDGEWTLDAIIEGSGKIQRSVPLGTAKTGARDLKFKLAE